MGTITYNLSVTAQNDWADISRNPIQVSIPWAGEKYVSRTEELTTTYKSLTVTDDMVTLGITYLHNIGTEDIIVSMDDGVTDNIVLSSGEFSTFRLCPDIVISKIKAKALTLAATLEYCIYSD